MKKAEVLSTIILRSQASYRYVRRYLRGRHPKEGVLSVGHTGCETIVETDSIIPIKVYTVKEN